MKNNYTNISTSKIEEIHNHPEFFLERCKVISGRPSYKCLLCGNGSGADRTGMVALKDGVHFRCYKCGFRGDLLDHITQAAGMGVGQGNTKDGMAYVLNLYDRLKGNLAESELGWNDSISSERAKAEERDFTPLKEEPTHPQQESSEISFLGAKGANWTDFISAAQETERKTGKAASYLAKRGISPNLCRQCEIGFDEQKNSIIFSHATFTRNEPCYHARNTSTKFYSLPEHGEQGVFNPDALLHDVCCICEGAVDALSAMQSGLQALSIGSASNAGQFLRFVESHKQEIAVKRFIVCTDNDSAGQNAAKTLSEGLTALGYAVEDLSFPSGGEKPLKDLNEWLTSDAQGLKTALAEAASSVVADEPTEAEAPETPIERTLREASLVNLLGKFSEHVEQSKTQKPISTGFKGLDYVLGGGLLPKLYILGGMSGTGKTTLALQICDSIARSGTPVMVYSLEMAADDLLARSISRETYRLAMKRDEPTLARTELDVLLGSRYADYTPNQIRCIDTAKQVIASRADKMTIFAGRRTADEIFQLTEAYIRKTGFAPVVLIDYLQLIAPSESVRRADTREQTNYAMEMLCKMRRDLRTPVLCLSAFNRTSYGGSAATDSFRESSDIEYSADFLGALEMNLPNTPKSSANADREYKQAILNAMRASERDVRLSILKNRGGQVGSKLAFRYVPRFNHFAEELSDSEE